KNYYEVNGARQLIDCAPYIKNGRTMLPLRYIGYALGLQEKDIEYRQTADGKTCYLRRPYIRNGQKGSDEFITVVGKKDFILNGWEGYGKLDVPPEMVKGRTMVPFRAAVQALGGLCYWNSWNKSVTIVTWAENPNPIPMPDVKKVEVTLDSREAKVTTSSGTKIVYTDRPALMTTTGTRCMLDVVQLLKLWGVPDNAILFDEKRGGLAVRGTALNRSFYDSHASAGYVYFYSGTKQAWESFNQQFPKMSEVPKCDPIYAKNGRFYADIPACYCPGARKGGESKCYWTNNNNVLVVEVK
ncbi:MAG: copper amine oxidase N-terminal domain-containing protein, partial [Candidatus Saccharibacteria bacterium]